MNFIYTSDKRIPCKTVLSSEQNFLIVSSKETSFKEKRECTYTIIFG